MHGMTSVHVYDVCVYVSLCEGIRPMVYVWSQRTTSGAEPTIHLVERLSCLPLCTPG